MSKTQLKDKGFRDISETAVRGFATFWTFLVAIGFLMGAIWLLWRIKLDDVPPDTVLQRQLIATTAFAAVFGVWIALFTSAKRAEIFGATAAYAAVLVVFVGIT